MRSILLNKNYNIQLFIREVNSIHNNSQSPLEEDNPFRFIVFFSGKENDAWTA